MCTGIARFVSDPAEVHSLLNGHILQCEQPALPMDNSDASVATLKVSRSTDV